MTGEASVSAPMHKPPALRTHLAPKQPNYNSSKTKCRRAGEQDIRGKTCIRSMDKGRGMDPLDLVPPRLAPTLQTTCAAQSCRLQAGRAVGTSLGTLDVCTASVLRVVRLGFGVIAIDSSTASFLFPCFLLRPLGTAGLGGNWNRMMGVHHIHGLCEMVVELKGR
ncbi:hypothetical protein BDW66DRAFT_56308 [Aspergillus desertorum]